MNRWYQPDVFNPHSDYCIPVGENLLTDTYHPETNSLGYNYKISQYKRPADYLPFYTSIAQNTEGLFILASNNFNTAVYDCVIGGSDNFDNYISSDYDGAKFKIHLKENVFKVEYLADSLFLATTTSFIDLYSTKEPLLDGNIMNRVNRTFSDGEVTQIQVMDNYRVILGTQKGSIECYEYSESFQNLFTFLNAHETEITDLCAIPNKSNQWMSLSSFECLYWDKRQICPARAFLEKKSIASGLTTVNCYKDTYVILTDNSGEIMVFDNRKSDNVVFQMTINDDIEQVHFNEDKFGVISRNSDKTRFFEMNCIQETVLLHEHISPKPIYSLCWDKTANKTDVCYIVGSEKYAKEIRLNTSV